MYRFYSNPDENGVRVSVVGEYDEENRTFSVAVSRCSSKDAFIRKKGRAIAEGRLRAGKLYDRVPFVEKRPTVKEFVKIAKDVAQAISRDISLITAYSPPVAA